MFLICCCLYREAAQRTASPAAPAESPAESGGTDNGKRESVAAGGLFTSHETSAAGPAAKLAQAPHADIGSSNGSSHNADSAGRGLFTSGAASAAAQGLFASRTTHTAAPSDLPRGSTIGGPMRTLKLQDPFPSDPRPSTDPENDLHVRSHAGYLDSHHMCGGSNIELFNLAVPAAGPGYAERWV